MKYIDSGDSCDLLLQFPFTNNIVSQVPHYSPRSQCFMCAVDAAQLTNRIEEALKLSEKAADDPEVAQALTDLLKDLQTYQVRNEIPICHYLC